jgi:CRP-like cAMP-binding protein
MARHGMFEQLTGFEGMPGRAHLHMGYNLTITVPTVLGFLYELRTIKNKYLEMVFDKLSSKELSQLSVNVKHKTFKMGEDVIEQGEIATFCYVITKGTADVLLNKGKDNEALIATLGEGDLFGEIGLLDDKTKTRTATVTASKKLKCLEIDAKTFADLIDEKTGDYRSETTSANIKQLVALRLSQLSEA